MKKILIAFTIMTLCLAGGAAWAAGQTVTITGLHDGNAYGNSADESGDNPDADPWDNILNIESGADITGSAYGARYDGPDEVKNNAVSMNGGKVGWGIYGGYKTGAGDAKDNTVTINDGEAGSEVFGGYSWSGDAKDNTVTISGGKVGGYVAGGYSEARDAKDNTVTISS
ncbi:MAG: hypothetical protein FWG09_07880, partial [Synergistaceae bacterium]|nr:hypothetical protein [Synergistaceae bacterium]